MWPSTEQIEALSRIGVFGFFIIAGAAFYLRRFKLTADVNDAKTEVEAERTRERAVAAERLEEARKERDEWKSIAQTYGESNDKLATAVERQTDAFERAGLKLTIDK